MGEARRKQALAAALEAQRAPLALVAGRVSHALRRLAQAASAHLGGDCYLHAELGRALLTDFDIQAMTRVGYAAWRVGPGSADVLAHRPQVPGHLLPGATIGFAYHAWLEMPGWILDFTSYQLKYKAQLLDAADGGHTRVDWCPDYLLLPHTSLQRIGDVARATNAGAAYYESDDGLTAEMADGYALPDADLKAARLLLRNADMRVIGPNTPGYPPHTLP